MTSLSAAAYKYTPQAGDGCTRGHVDQYSSDTAAVTLRTADMTHRER
jgi:hypothetical protein